MLQFDGTSIPSEELLVWEDVAVRDSLLRGSADVEAGRIEDVEAVINS